MEKMITGNTGLMALLGSPVDHSISPMMHNEAFQQLGLDYVYLCFECGTDQLEQTVQGLKQMGVRGFNLTMPNKQLMCGLCDHLSEAAQIAGSVNTVVNDNGVLTGYTTDGIGYMQAALDAGYDLVGRRMTLLGAGGAATAILVQAALDGMEAIHVFNKRSDSFTRAEKIIEELRKRTSCQITLDDFTDPEVLRRAIADSHILTNATSVGMVPQEDSCIITDASMFHKDLIVSDIIYNPRETKLLQMARKAGCRTFNGLYMLLYQGAEAFKLWTGEDMPVEIVKKKYFRQTLPYNIMLIGFMGSGKSTVASRLGKLLDMDVYEMDAEIEAKQGQSIPDIFDTYGEEYFRNLESNTVIELQKETGKVVSCGGGAVLREENVRNMKKNGRIIYLTATPHTIYERVKNSRNRPLLNNNMNVEYIAALMEKRSSRYAEAADLEISTDNKSIKEICEELIDRLRELD